MGGLLVSAIAHLSSICGFRSLDALNFAIAADFSCGVGGVRPGSPSVS